MINPMIKILLGFGLMVVIWFMFPILDILEIFVQLVAVPIIFIACICVGVEGGYEAVRVAINSGFFGELRGRLTAYREMRGKQPPTTSAA